MTVKQIKLSDHSVSCDFCDRNLLRGEIAEPLFNAGEERLACELCRMRALRGGWHRESVPAARPPRTANGDRGRFLDRLRGRQAEIATRPETPTAPPRVKAEPRGSVGREKAAIEHFNASAQRQTIASVSHSLGAPTVTVADAGEDGVIIVAAWDICWYRWRVDMAQGGVNVTESGRGAELTELSPLELTGGVMVGSDGRLTRI